LRLLLGAVLVAALSISALAHAASVYVMVDSWVYPAAERLAVLTGTRTEFMGMRPWTRTQFAHFLERARQKRHDVAARGLQIRLEREFAPELAGQQEPSALQSAYARGTYIGGTPVRDSYHFGQTFVNDYGRPYGEGFNGIAGADGYFQHRALMLSIDGEFQHAGALPTVSPEVLAAENAMDHEGGTSKLISGGGPAVDRFRLLDTYVGASFTRWTATIGRQSMWWGPATGGAFLESNNAEPFWMGRLTNDEPYTLPLLGKIRLDMFYGRLQDHPAFPGVWAHGEKITIQPLSSLEFGFSRTTEFLGPNRPFNLHRLWITYFSIDDGAPGNKKADDNWDDPGDRRAGFDVTWRVPGVPMTLYGDSFSDDEPSPLASQTRSCFHPGIYIARMPGKLLAKLDLRGEGGYTVSEAATISPNFNYWNGTYQDGYTNNGLLIGDAAIGRASTYWQAWSTYWLSPRDKVQVSYRHRYIDPKVLQGAGTQGDARAVANFELKKVFEVEMGVQSERLFIPVLTGAGGAQYNTSGWIGLKYQPPHLAK
jgi:hypothetical protein